ncbi:hypothetical protein J2W42_004427 [Rhizobium tibeticum]|uniref:hypothetical protein n=1 Tax=Rhizobium tibeticum TaxID=501024 RepID=UPI00278A0A6F|nr:hypothetical protein [Rhizobium tibeticum]MDP9811563.1 hypothetical protein [Rhizobium tibeticum]
MTNTRARGFKSRELAAQLAELDDQMPVDEVFDESEPDSLEPAQWEIAWLRKEVSDLRERLTSVRGETETVQLVQEARRPWLHIGVTMAATSILAGLVQYYFYRRPALQRSQ